MNRITRYLMVALLITITTAKVEAQTPIYHIDNLQAVCAGELLQLPMPPTLPGNTIAYLWEISNGQNTNSGYQPFQNRAMVSNDSQRWIRLKVIRPNDTIEYSNSVRITVRSSSDITITRVVCDHFNHRGIIYTQSSDSITFDTLNNWGCAVTGHLHLTVNNSSYHRIDTVACDRYYWRGTLYTVSSDAMQTGTNTSGCPDTNILHLTINYSSTSNDVQTICDSYTWIDGNTYTTNNNTAQYTIFNSQQCDSIITLNLSINHSTFGTDIQTACDSYTWIDGNTYTANNNTAQYTIYNSQHCDSTITLNLTVNHSTFGTDVQTACDSYTWIDGNIYTANNNTARYTIYNSNHCDSIITLNLTIHQSDTTGSISADECDSYTWHGETYNQSGDYKYRTHTSQGCDSLCTLHLTIRHSSASSDVITECHQYTWRNGETYYTDTTNIRDTITNTEGCDSVITLFLTIIQNERPPVRDLVVKNLGTDSPKMVLYPRNANETDYAYQWFKDSMTIEGATKQYYLLDGEDIGIHTFSVYVSPVEQVLCGSTSSKEITLTGVPQPTLTVSPNPNNGVFEIAFSSPEEHAREIDIYSQTGCKVHESTLHENVARIQEQLPTGIYTLKLTTDKGNTYTQKIIVK